MTGRHSATGPLLLSRDPAGVPRRPPVRLIACGAVGVLALTFGAGWALGPDGTATVTAASAIHTPTMASRCGNRTPLSPAGDAIGRALVIGDGDHG